MKNLIKLTILLLVGLCKTQAQNVLEQQITANTPYLGQYATVNLTIDDANGDNEITHPLIVAEGFDLGIIIAPENYNGYQDYGDFRRSLLTSGSNLRNLVLESGKDYDIIYVDWNNGVDYLQRNAYALEAVIAWVNSVKIGTEPNVVLGQSMGGVIARWALADMEERGLTHDTRLFISHDAPQQGANIPASLQYMYRHGGNQYVQTGQTLGGAILTIPLLELTLGVSNYLSLLDTPATKQLLKNTATTNYAMVNTDHNTFYNELKNKGVSGSNGYPINCRNIAISNGSECGNTQDFLPGEHLVNFQWNKGLSFWGDLASLIYNPLGGFFGGYFVDNSLFGVAALGLIPGHSKYNVDFQAKTIPYGNGNQIYKGVISYTKKILWLINVTINITNVQKNQPFGVLPFDTYGGGFYNVNQFIDTNSLPSGVFIRDKFSFIPTASALDIGENNISLIDSDYLKSYIGKTPPSSPKNSPFDNYSTEFDNANPNAGNYGHISFNNRNGDWLAAELLNSNIQFTDCSFRCSDVEITGNSSLCTSDVYSVSSNGLSFYNWSITEGSSLVTMSGNGSPSITLTKNGISTGFVTMQVSMGVIGTNCGNNVLTKRVFVDSENINIITAEYDDFCTDSYNYIGLVALGATNTSYLHFTNFQSTIPSQDHLITYEPNGYTPDGFRKYLIVVPRTLLDESITYNIGFINKCGVSVTRPGDFPLIPYECSSNLTSALSSNMYIIHPNPSSSIINITLLDKMKTPLKKTNITGKLYDLNNNEKRKIVIKNNNGQIDASGLNKGIYVLQINVDNKLETHQVIIN